ncbi:hypothetical protein F7734_27705 [Scytonema sp. UIC 10036]|uniref:hypothetical protein n=1 Tax=Scytonema sp. UIC 10036 TaxID=2304196 RepID=UPI0012DA40F4|nr:hypothetical protein [Scytonema sp. UIC 10036]MUG95932.1 hypothetical protein [Scytonema sp. UIC 10036]
MIDSARSKVAFASTKPIIPLVRMRSPELKIIFFHLHHQPEILALLGWVSHSVTTNLSKLMR